VEVVKQKSKDSENGLQFIADKGMKNIRREKQMNRDKVMHVLPQSAPLFDLHITACDISPLCSIMAICITTSGLPKAALPSVNYRNFHFSSNCSQTHLNKRLTYIAIIFLAIIFK
jgi:hypothetical protein